MKEVTDPDLLKQLDSGTGGKEVTDPSLLSKLEGVPAAKPVDVGTTFNPEAQMDLPNAQPGVMTNPLKAIVQTPSIAGEAAGEGVLTAGAKLHAPPEVTAGLATVANLGVSSLNPFGGAAGKGAGSALEVASRKAPAIGSEELMSSAMKISRKVKSGEAATAIRTMLDEGINVTKGGVQKLRAKIDQLNTEIKDAIASSSGTVNKAQVTKYLDEVAKNFKKQVNPQSDLASIRKAFDDFMEHPELVGKSNIPVQQAQELKQGTYRVLSGKAYGEVGTASTEAQKALARGLKEGIAEQVPAIAELNARESKMLATLTPLEHRVVVEAGKNPGGLVYLAHDPVAAAAFLADRSAAAKSILAHMIENAGKKAQKFGGIAGVVAADQPQLRMSDAQ